jgi:transcriptional regulator of arginine metabolism
MNNNPSGAAARRHHAILQLVRDARVRSQGELARLLRQRGFAVAQPTLSRDLRELGLAKTPAGYVAPELPAGDPAARQTRLGRALRGAVLSIQPAGALVVIRTPPAAAQPVARALDEAPPAGVVGTVAGDDTVFVATPSDQAARGLARRLAILAGEPARRLPA